MGDVSKKLMNQFATNLNTMLDEQTADPRRTPSRSRRRPARRRRRRPNGRRPPSGNGAAAPARRRVRKIDGPAAEPIELSDVAGSAMLKRLLPLVGGLVLLLSSLRRLRRR